jgi:capsular polysaccharide biosynthesis protein
MMHEPGRAVAWPARTDDDLLSAYEDSVLDGDRAPGGSGTGLVSLGYLAAALRRTRRMWLALGLIGLIVAGAYAVVFPHPPQATVSVLLVDDPSQNPADEAATDVALAESLPVATAVVHQLGLSQSPAKFAGTYSAAATTDQVVTITAQGSSSEAAVNTASAVATQFLKLRGQYETTQQQQTQAQLNQQVTQAQQTLDTVNAKLKQVQAEPASAARTAQLHSLEAQQTSAASALTTVQNYAAQTQATAQTLTQSMVGGSRVLNTAAPVGQSATKNAVLYGAGGLIGGLVLGMAIAVIMAVTSDRLRRRDDIAVAFGAPVRLSVGPLRERPGVSLLPGRAAVRQRDADRVLDHLGNAIPGSSKGPASLAVVAVDDPSNVAKLMVELAVAKASAGSKVVLADLSDGAQAARLLDFAGPGIGEAGAADARIAVVVPGADEIAPVGPLQSPATPEGYATADEALVAVCADADLVLSLVTLDPAFGAEHLATWATEAVAVVTAGRSTSVRIGAVGEMIRLAGTRLGSVVVIGADSSDESLGSAGALA